MFRVHNPRQRNNNPLYTGVRPAVLQQTVDQYPEAVQECITVSIIIVNRLMHTGENYTPDVHQRRGNVAGINADKNSSQ